MAIGESLSEQQRRQRLSEQAHAAASILQHEWEKIDETSLPLRLARPHLLSRLKRICRNQTMSHVALGHVLLAEATNSSHGPLEYLEWLTREIELSLAPFAAGVYRYVRKHHEVISREQSIALLYLSISFNPEPEERATLVEFITRLAAQGTSLKLVPPPHDVSTDFVTREQKRVVARLLELADTYFSNQQLGAVRPRLFPLVIGPSGAGKTFLGRRVAKLAGAEYVSFTCADWVPLGANSEYEATLYAILIKVASHDRIVLCIDEIDKVRLDLDSSWGKSVSLDLLRVLDLNFPIGGFLKSGRASSEAAGITKERLAAKITGNLWIMGCGAWQSLHQKKPPLGFFVGAPPAQIDSHVIQQTATIPSELLLRFHPEVLQVSYPTPDETAELFKMCGLSDAAASLGIPLDAAKHDWTRGGLRSLEAIWGEVAIRKRKQQIDILKHG